MTSINLEKVTQSLTTCCVCFEQYDEVERQPKILPCYHTLCNICIQVIFTIKMAIFNLNYVTGFLLHADFGASKVWFLLERVFFYKQ